MTALVVVVADSVRADFLGRPGGPAKTPFFDGLATEGALFDTAISSAPWTVPSIASMLTGVYAHRLGLVKWEQPWPADRPSLFELAARRGLEVASFVFDPAHLFRNVPAAGVRGSSQDVEPMLRWIEERRGRDFVAFVHHWWTHVPYVAKPMSVRAWKEVSDAVLAAMRGSAIARAKARELYRLAVERFSEAFLPSLVGALDLDATWLVVTADHGESFGDREETARLRDVFDLHGNTLYREALEVPLLIRPPGGLPKGRRIGGLARTVDLMPTLAELLDLGPLPGDLDGVSLARCVREGAPAPTADAISAMNRDFVDLPELPESPDEVWCGFSITTPSRKAIVDTRAGLRRGFDLARDPGETADVCERDAAFFAPLFDRLEIERRRAIVGEVLPGDTARVRKRLKDLGYIE
jgi:arylsulfatase A-like enzyme